VEIGPPLLPVYGECAVSHTPEMPLAREDASDRRAEEMLRFSSALFAWK
jgi:hypothetical protein